MASTKQHQITKTNKLNEKKRNRYLDGLPDSIAIGADDHGTPDGAIVGELGGGDDVEVPGVEVLGARRDEAAVHAPGGGGGGTAAVLVAGGDTACGRRGRAAEEERRRAEDVGRGRQRSRRREEGVGEGWWESEGGHGHGHGRERSELGGHSHNLFLLVHGMYMYLTKASINR